ncbi:MAG: archaeal preflagellin peptidase FlaK [Thermoplasmata archaeon]|nr:archaeal preflagellin peptidase FlaK [Thermoplasmata archaeon]MEA3166867.1 archaeal preflagellin peptidase FlaK [Thermoplasmata archaeon]
MDDAAAGIRFLLGFAMLAGAVPSDLRTRRVPNSWWLPFVAMAAILAVTDLVAPGRDWTTLAVRYGAAAVVAGLMYVFWRFRLFGGADAKALMVLAFLAPWPSPSPASIQPALDAVANGSLLMLGLPVVAFVFNLARGQVAFPAMLLGRPVPLAKARAAHVWPMQRVLPDGSLGWRFWQRAGLDSLDGEYDALARAGVTRVWVTAKVPFLVPLAAGLALAWKWGNLPALLAQSLA